MVEFGPLTSTTGCDPQLTAVAINLRLIDGRADPSTSSGSNTVDGVHTYNCPVTGTKDICAPLALPPPKVALSKPRIASFGGALCPAGLGCVPPLLAHGLPHVPANGGL